MAKKAVGYLNPREKGETGREKERHREAEPRWRALPDPAPRVNRPKAAENRRA